MVSAQTRSRILKSRFLRVIVFPYRVRIALGDLISRIRLLGQWLLRSSEFTNYSYDLTERNRLHLAHFVAHTTNCLVEEAHGWIEEILDNDEFRACVRRQISRSRRGVEVDKQIDIARRAGWYATIRATRPEVLVETGTDKGLGSCVIGEAILKNGVGHLYTIDIEAESGFLIGQRHESVVTRLIGDSIGLIGTLKAIDWFMHDSDHSAEHEAAEFRAVWPRLTERALCLSDNAHVTDVLADWSRAHDRLFLFFQEQPAGHWYRGAGIGASWKPSVSIS